MTWYDDPVCGVLAIARERKIEQISDRPRDSLDDDPACESPELKVHPGKIETIDRPTSSRWVLKQHPSVDVADGLRKLIEISEALVLHRAAQTLPRNEKTRRRPIGDAGFRKKSRSLAATAT